MRIRVAAIRSPDPRRQGRGRQSLECLPSRVHRAGGLGTQALAGELRSHGISEQARNPRARLRPDDKGRYHLDCRFLAFSRPVERFHGPHGAWHLPKPVPRFRLTPPKKNSIMFSTRWVVDFAGLFQRPETRNTSRNLQASEKAGSFLLFQCSPSICRQCRPKFNLYYYNCVYTIHNIYNTTSFLLLSLPYLLRTDRTVGIQ